MDYEKTVNSLQDELIETLQNWIRIPSVKSAAVDRGPFGESNRIMLEKALQDAADMGFSVRNIDGYAGDVRMGPEGVNPLAILSHLDVVPAGDGWETAPFDPVVKNGNIYGRGSSDDKGPAVAALYAMYAIKKAGIPLKREVRLILGCDEESGMECMSYYMKHCDMPRSGFSPDACFPVINTEKGSIGIRLNAVFANEGISVKSIHVGERTNVIPGKASAVLEGNSDLADLINARASEMGVDVKAAAGADGSITVNSTGIPGHAAFPESARNALGQMLVVLKKAGMGGPLGVLADKVGMEYDGLSMGIRCSDETSGALTCNLGILNWDAENGMSAWLDLRCPMLADLNGLCDTITAAFEGTGVNVTVTGKRTAHHVSPTGKLVTCLLDAYHEVTGLEKKCIAIGGGTYARILEEGVAFGSIFPDEEELAHQANEYMPLESLRRNVLIFVNAILKLQDA